MRDRYQSTVASEISGWTHLAAFGTLALQYRGGILKIVKTLLILAALVVCIQSVAEDIVLKDGTKITGQITGVAAEKFVVKTAFGEIQVPKTEIVSISFPENKPKEAPFSTTSKPAVMIEESIQGKTYTNQTEQFQVTIPDGWTTWPEMVGGDIHGAIKSPDETLFMFYTPEKFAGNISTYVVLAETQLKTKFKDFEELSRSDVTLDGKPAIRIVWHGKNTTAHDTPFKALFYVVPGTGAMNRLSFLTIEDLFEPALPTFEKIAASYKSTGK